MSAYGLGFACVSSRGLIRLAAAQFVTFVVVTVLALAAMVTGAGSAVAGGMDSAFIREAGLSEAGLSEAGFAPGDGRAVPIVLGAARHAQSAGASKEFKDVPVTHNFRTHIAWLADAGITTGWADGTFRPGSKVTREAMAAFLYRAVGSPDFVDPQTATFKDVPKTSGFFHEIEWLATTGITTSWADGTFRPGGFVTRESMAAFIYRAVGKPEFTVPAEPTFSDVQPATGETPASSRFVREVEWLATTGITTGWSDGTFRPQQSVTRESMAAFLDRAQELLPKHLPQVTIPGLTGHSALIRVEVPQATSDVVVWAAGAPVLEVTGGQPGIGTVLVPVGADGALPVYASAVTNGQVEVLASFAGEISVPGSVFAVPFAVNRANSAAPWAPSEPVGAVGVQVGLVGRGGVPATGVRAVFLTALVDAPTAGIIGFGNQEFAVVAGVNSISTVVMPDDRGGTTVTY